MVLLDNRTLFVVFQIGNINTDLGWRSYLGEGAFYTSFSITAPIRMSYFLQVSVALFLVTNRCHVLWAPFSEAMDLV